MKHLSKAIALGLITALPVSAESVALIIGNEDYRGADDVRRGDEVTGARARLEAAGVKFVVAREATAADLREAMGEFDTRAEDAEQILVVLSGRFIHTETETYFLPVDIGSKSFPAMTQAALPLSVVLAYLAEAPGEAILALATDERDGAYGTRANVGIGDLDLPQGVTLLTGIPRQMRNFLNSTIAVPGQNIGDAVRRSSISASGYLGRGQTWLPKPPPEPEPAQAPAPQTDDRLQDLMAWRQADRANTAEAYDDYMKRFPSGQFVRMAENRINALTDTPEARAERAEQSLDLTRDQRRDIQRDLSLLEYNTRGIDGIFGRGTRAAVSDWQRANNFDPTGFLNRDQITRLDAQAERRAAELEAEAERRREEQLAADRAFWAETGSVGDEAGLRIYLERFPDGEFAEIAQARLEDIEREKRAETNARDRQLWDEASNSNTVQAYRDYLELAPGGAFREEAAERIAALTRADADQGALAQAKREEDALRLSQSTRRVIESRLDRLGLKPGRVDGTFDETTRRAIRRYQSARNLPETGYLNENVVVQLLADSVRSIFRQ